MKKGTGFCSLRRIDEAPSAEHVKQLLTEALESRLDVRTAARNARTAPRWMRAYGALRHLRRERKAIERAIESEFEKIEPEDRSSSLLVWLPQINH
jgi:hypothetical protein